MRIRSYLFAGFLISLLLIPGLFSFSQTWTQKASMPVPGRSVAAAFSIGLQGYIGTGGPTSGPFLDDLWQWDQPSNTWTQMANFTGGPRACVVAWSIQNKGYYCNGTDLASYFNDLWEYDPIANTWTQMATMPVAPRGYSTGFAIGNYGYVCTGYDALGNMLNDLWEWNQATNTWLQKASLPGVPRCLSTGTATSTKGYISCGLNTSFTMENDLWEYDQATDTWAPKPNFPGTNRHELTSFSLNQKVYVGCGDASYTTTFNDLYEFDPATNTWTTFPALPASVRELPVSFVIGCAAYIATGWDEQSFSQNYFNDLWEVSIGPSLAVSASPMTLCQGDSSVLTATTSNNYLWSTGATTQSITVFPTSTTTYSVSSTNGVCTSTQAVTITVAPPPNAQITGNLIICPNTGGTTLTATGGVTYLWSTGATSAAITVNPTTTTTYSVLVGVGSCTDTTSVTVSVASAPSPAISGNTAICAGQQTTLTASGGGTYLWNTNATTTSITVSPSTSTTYSVVVTDPSTGCTADTSIAVVVLPSPSITLTGPSNVCSGSNATLIATGAVSYVWSNGSSTGSITVNPTTTSTYTVTGTSVNGCTSTSTVTINVIQPPNAQISGNDSICPGDQVTLTATGGNNYGWSNGSTASSINVSPSSTTTYTVIVSSAPCPADTATFLVYVQPPGPVLLNVPADMTVCLGEQITLTATANGGAPAYQYIWSTLSGPDQFTNPNSAQQVFSPTAQGSFFVSVIDACGRTTGDTINILVRPCELTIPNVITPNGDSENEFFVIKNLGEFPNSRLIIYNRWGNLIYENGNYLNDWAAKDVTDGTYYFVLYVSDGRIFPGYLTVLNKK
jgi:gliding motility-associated-like protein